MNNRTGVRGAFTLIELLVVIAIIGILAALLMTGVSAAMKYARNTKASADARQIATAWESYLREYSVWPAGFGGTEGSDPALIDDATNMLAGADQPVGANRSKIPFLEARNRPFRDPWGERYRYMLDLNYDAKVTSSWHETIGRNVIAWSTGLDKSDATPSTREDDRCSWR